MEEFTLQNTMRFAQLKDEVALKFYGKVLILNYVSCS